MRILFIGDIVGSLGREQLESYLPKLKQKYQPQLTIVNGENAAAGKNDRKRDGGRYRLADMDERCHEKRGDGEAAGRDQQDRLPPTLARLLLRQYRARQAGGGRA